jgi:hypothetical protein
MRHGPAGGEHLRKEIRLLTREVYRAWIARLLLLLPWHHNSPFTDLHLASRNQLLQW